MSLRCGRVILLCLAPLVLLPLVEAQSKARSRPDFYASNEVLEAPRKHPWKRRDAARVGLDVAALEEVTLRLGQRTRCRSFLVARSGFLAWEKGLNGGEARQSRNVHSVSKSLLGALAGIAIAEGRLQGEDHALLRHLDAFLPAKPDPRRGLTLRHLLTMTAGLAWKEDVTEYRIQREPSWVRAILHRSRVAEPGTRFRYSTGCTHVLSALLTRATGTATHEYAQKKLLGPLGIKVARWGAPDPEGFDSGGCNVFLTPRELLRLGQFFLDQGRHGGRQLVPRRWIERSWEKHHRVDEVYAYGFLWWLFRAGPYEVALAWGHGDQFLFVIPSLGIVMVITSDTKGRIGGDLLDPARFMRRWLPRIVPAGKASRAAEGGR